MPGGTLERHAGVALEAADIVAMVAEEPAALRRRLEVERQMAERQAAILADDQAAGMLAGYGFAAVQGAAEVAVPADYRQDLVLGAGAVFQCYDRCWWYLIRHSHIDGVRLHHGLVLELGKAWPHCWVWLPGGEDYPAGVVFEPAVSRFYEATSWRDALQAVSLHSYTAAEAAERVRTEGPPGPWTEHNRALEVLAAERLAELAAEHPRLSEWFGWMLERDPGFAAHVARRRAENPIAVVHLLEDLAADPSLWADHVPGQPYDLVYREYH